MPTYDYRCSACGEVVEVVHGVHASGPAVCPSCGEGPLTKTIAPPTIVFKGSGWAKKDRSSRPSSSGSTPKVSETPSADSGDTSGTKSTTPATVAAGDGGGNGSGGGNRGTGGKGEAD